MQQPQKAQDRHMMQNAFTDELINVCRKCGNIYQNVWLKTGDNWNDFGFRYCPFCGVQTEEFAHIA